MFQEDWKWCSLCQGLFFAGNNTLGTCPATWSPTTPLLLGGHNPTGSGDYTLATSDSGLSSQGQSGWKWCSQCQGLFFAGGNMLGACPAAHPFGHPHTDVGSGDYTLATSGYGQDKWKWCHQCQGLFFAGNNALAGFCPATPGLPHTDVGSSDYSMFYLGGQSNFILANADCQPLRDISVTINVQDPMVVESVVPAGSAMGFGFQLNAWSPQGATLPWQQYCLILCDWNQPGWKWCNRCQGLFYSGSGDGVCPAGGAHNDAGSGDYALGQGGDDDLAASSGGQSDWKWCSQCQGLFFAGNNFGVCPASPRPLGIEAPGPHSETGSGNYLLATSGGGQSGWKWCHQCQGLFFAGNNLGVCPASPRPLGIEAPGPHSDAGSGDYTLTTSSDGQIYGMVDNWDASLTGVGTINNKFHAASLPSHTVPAGYQLKIWLENDAAGNITGAGFSVADGSGHPVGTVTRTLLAIPGTTSADLAPIVAFQLNLVGPINGESAVLSSGSGTITYSANVLDLVNRNLTAMIQVPPCSSSAVTTGENANSFYDVLPDTPSTTFTQYFYVSTAMPMIRAAGKPRPATRIPVPSS